MPTGMTTASVATTVYQSHDVQNIQWSTVRDQVDFTNDADIICPENATTNVFTRLFNQTLVLGDVLEAEVWLDSAGTGATSDFYFQFYNETDATGVALPSTPWAQQAAGSPALAKYNFRFALRSGTFGYYTVTRQLDSGAPLVRLLSVSLTSAKDYSLRGVFTSAGAGRTGTARKVIVRLSNPISGNTHE
jgi:hypothetical protein